MENLHSKNILLIFSFIFLFSCNNAEIKPDRKTRKGDISSEVSTPLYSESHLNKNNLEGSLSDHDESISDRAIPKTYSNHNDSLEIKGGNLNLKDKKSNVKDQTSVKKKKTKKKKRYPKIEFDNEVYDFGEITEGDTINYNFNFKNTGKKTLDIKSTDATCGCTQPSFPFLGVEPGEKGTIGVRYISVGKSGPQEATITVKSNADYPTKKLLLKGIVNKRDKSKEEE